MASAHAGSMGAEVPVSIAADLSALIDRLAYGRSHARHNIHRDVVWQKAG